MPSQFFNSFTFKQNRVAAKESAAFALRSVVFGGAIAVACCSWIVSTNAAERSPRFASSTSAKASVSSIRTASVLGGPVATNYGGFRNYCKNPINATEVKTLCLSMIEGGPIDSSLTPDDEPLTSPLTDEVDQVLIFQTVPSSAIATYQYNPLLYQYDKVTLYPLQ